MTAQGYRNNKTAMGKAIGGFDDAATSLRGTMKALDTDLTAEVKKYKGAQAVAFWDLHRAITADMEKASKELHTMSTNVHTSTKKMTAKDAELAQRTKKLTGQTGNPVFDRLHRR